MKQDGRDVGPSHQPVEVSEDDLVIMRCIDEIHLEYAFMGSRRIALKLADVGHHVNGKKVQRLMLIMRLYALYPKKKQRHRTSHIKFIRIY